MSAICNSTERCPTNAKSWKKREEHFNCGRRTYACILTAEDDLVETCMFTYDIAKNYAGCPVIRCDYGEPILAPDEFAYCPGEINGCPSTNHPGYNTKDLLKYPRCLVRRKDRFPSGEAVHPASCNSCNTTGMNGTTLVQNFGFSLAAFLPVLLYAIIITALLLFLVAWMYRRKGRELTVPAFDEQHVREQSPQLKSCTTELSSLTFDNEDKDTNVLQAGQNNSLLSEYNKTTEDNIEMLSSPQGRDELLILDEKKIGS